MNFFNIVPVNGYSIDQNKISHLFIGGWLVLCISANLVSNDDLDTCVLDFLAQSVRNT